MPSSCEANGGVSTQVGVYDCLLTCAEYGTSNPKKHTCKRGMESTACIMPDNFVTKMQANTWQMQMKHVDLTGSTWTTTVTLSIDRNVFLEYESFPMLTNQFNPTSFMRAGGRLRCWLIAVWGRVGEGHTPRHT